MLKQFHSQVLIDEADAVDTIEHFSVDDREVDDTLWFGRTMFKNRRYIISYEYNTFLANGKRFYIKDNDVIQKTITYKQIPLRFNALSAFDVDMVMKYLKERGLECCPLKGEI